MIRRSGSIGYDPAGCSKRPSSKATANEGPKAYPLGYVEGLNDARTTLADFFSILLGLLLPPVRDVVARKNYSGGAGRPLVVKPLGGGIMPDSVTPASEFFV